MGNGMTDEMMGGMMGLGMGVWMLLWAVMGIALLTAAVLGVVRLLRRDSFRAGGPAPTGTAAEEILRRRYANGEIDDEEFTHRRAALS